MKIAVTGIGYVGLSAALLLADEADVWAVDVDARRLEMLRAGLSPIADREIEARLRARDRRLTFTTDAAAAYRDAAFVLVCTPTDYDPMQDRFNTASVESVVRQAAEAGATAIIRSTVPIGFTAGLRARLGYERILFCPEFLREGRALYDNLHPARILVGVDAEGGPVRQAAETLAALLVGASRRPGVPVRFMGTTEAEAVKLFANTYLALRVAFFNELDSFAARAGLDSEAIIGGIGLDPRIGNHYNNPSFGYGGYCLPKDTRQLRAEFRRRAVPEALISAVVAANEVRRDFIADEILARHPRTVGIYRLTMKTGSDNFRSAAVLGVIRALQARGVDVVVYEPGLRAGDRLDVRCEPDLAAFKQAADIILANRADAMLSDALDKVYTRDIFQRD